MGIWYCQKYLYCQCEKLSSFFFFSLWSRMCEVLPGGGGDSRKLWVDAIKVGSSWVRKEKGPWTGSQIPVDWLSHIPGCPPGEGARCSLGFLASVVGKNKNTNLAKLRGVLWYTTDVMVCLIFKLHRAVQIKGWFVVGNHFQNYYRASVRLVQPMVCLCSPKGSWNVFTWDWRWLNS